MGAPFSLFPFTVFSPSTPLFEIEIRRSGSLRDLELLLKIPHQKFKVCMVFSIKFQIKRKYISNVIFSIAVIN